MTKRNESFGNSLAKGVIDLSENFCENKVRLLRNSEYYCIQHEYDKLYERSLKNENFNNLMQLIKSDNNILLAYRNIKRNAGSHTSGVDKLTVKDYEDIDSKEFIDIIRNKINNYKPKPVKRVMIPKSSGKLRPLGIPCFIDRIVQQCIKQVLEPICEAKFYDYSFGFRPHRSTKDAIARSMFLMNRGHSHYVVDIDIKGFFDNVDHAKLLKQMWTMGIKDKNLLSIISKMLKSEIKGEGIPTKGTPQGGILSPLLSNIVLNELDWWVSSQWENIKTRYKYSRQYSARTNLVRTNANLKQCWLVRYADDFKIFTKDYKSAQRLYNGVRLWLKDRLGLDISPEKSKITNLRKNYTEFLGIKLKVNLKKKKYVCQSFMTRKSVLKVIEKLKEQVKKLQKNTTQTNMTQLNAIILGTQRYYSIATNVNQDFHLISYIINRTIDIRLKQRLKYKLIRNKTFDEYYSAYTKCKHRTIKGITIFPIHGIRCEKRMNYNQDICSYTKEGRELVHKSLKGSYFMLILNYLHRGNEHKSTELFDNSISLLSGQKGCCFVTKEMLEIGKMECHHKKPKFLGGSDKYSNLVWLCTDVHKLVHSTKDETISKYLEKLKLDENSLIRVNKLRELVGNCKI